jgi:hypothetical protein
MGFMAKDSGGGNFKKVPNGSHMGRCYSLIDLGTQLTKGQFGEKMQHKIKLSWELWGEDEQGHPLTIDINGKEIPLTISKSYTVSLHEKAALRKDLAAWRGKDFTEEEAAGFDVSKLIGAYGMVNVTTSENGGKTYTNVAGISPVPAMLKNAKPDPAHKNLIFNLDDPDMALFETFHEKLQAAIANSPEFQQKTGRKTTAPSGTGFDDVEDDGNPPF